MEQCSGCICCITTTSLALAPSCPLPACRCIRLCLSRWFDWPQLPIDRKNDGGTRCLALCIYSFPHHTCNPLRFYIAVTHTLIYPLSPSSSRLASLLGIAASLRRVCVCVAYDSPAIEQLLAKNLRAEPSPPPSFRLLYKVEKSKDLRTVCRFMNLKGGKRHNGRLHGNSLHLRRARVQAPLLNGTRPMLSHRNMKVRGQTHIKDNKP